VISLFGSEFLRIRSRRVVWMLAALAVAGMIVGCVLIAANTHRVSGGTLASAHALYERNVQACLAGHTYPLTPAESAAQTCREQVHPADFLPSGTFGMVLLPEIFQHIDFIIVLIGLVIGASAVGADWQSGSIGTLLTWETRRTRIWIARVVVVCLVVFVLALALLALLAVLFVFVAATRGTFAWLDGTWVRDSIGTAGRVAATATLGTLLGLSVAMIGRSSTAALAGVFVYLAVFESLVRAIYPKIGQWLLGPNVAVFVQGVATSPGIPTRVTLAHSVLVISLYAVVPFAIALLWFRARDVGT
jgi:ABC-type transport system involved in multi-copper enzyme maturation permease subunit